MQLSELIGTTVMLRQKHFIGNRPFHDTPALVMEIRDKSVWGTLKGVHHCKDVLGFEISRAHTNWFVEIGSMVMTGCRANYMVECPEAPKNKTQRHWSFDTPSGKLHNYETESNVLILE